jgi:GDP-L-fucose synthase
MLKKVFIAGHRGMVGSSLVRACPPDIQLLTTEIDLRDKDRVYSFLLEEKPDGVILAAAKVGGIASNSEFQSDFLVENLEIQNSVICASRSLGIGNFLFLGSSCIYPRLASQPISEDSLMTGTLEPTNEGYALAKIAGVRLIKAIYQETKLNYFSLMPTNLYGRNDNFSLVTSHVPAALMRKFHEAKVNGYKEVIVWGTGMPRREFMHVDDLAEACWYLIGKDLGGELINVGTGKDLEIGKFAELMSRVVGYEGQVLYDSTKPDGTPRKLLDVSKIHSYGWNHRIELEDGLRQTYKWFIDSLQRGKVRGY